MPRFSHFPLPGVSPVFGSPRGCSCRGGCDRTRCRYRLWHGFRKRFDALCWHVFDGKKECKDVFARERKEECRDICMRERNEECRNVLMRERRECRDVLMRECKEECRVWQFSVLKATLAVFVAIAY